MPRNAVPSRSDTFLATADPKFTVNPVVEEMPSLRWRVWQLVPFPDTPWNSHL